MSDESGFKFMWLGWCNEDNHDKIWGYIKLSSGSYYNFWGARGKSLRFKRHSGRWDLEDLTRVKRTRARERYREMTPIQMEKIWPGFSDTFGTQFVSAKFSGTIMTDDIDNNSFM